MLRKGRRAIYWDSDVWLSYVNAVPERLSVLDSLLAECSSPTGTITLLASEMVKVEVAFGASERAQRALDSNIEVQIDALWGDPHAVILVEYHSLIGDEARSLIRLAMTRGWSLKPMDAIHLATAKKLNVIEFHTYEPRLHRFSSDIGFPVVEPRTLQPYLMPPATPNTPP